MLIYICFSPLPLPLPHSLQPVTLNLWWRRPCCFATVGLIKLAQKKQVKVTIGVSDY